MILLIDNYDSFTYNIVHYLKDLKAVVKIIKNDELTIKQIQNLSPDKIIISPGPSNPDHAGISLEVIKYFHQKTPILGICLGNQVIAQYFGAKIIKINPKHGEISHLYKIDTKCPIFHNIKNDFKVARYHSLAIDKKSLNKQIHITSYAKDDNEIMSIHIKDTKTHGIQFHPESIGSKQGHKILGNFLKC